LVVTARCTCGWTGHPHHWGPASAVDPQAELDAHHHATGHAVVDRDDHLTHGIHPRCGHQHEASDGCPVPYTSPAGLLARVCQSTLGHPDAAEDRLSAAKPSQNGPTANSSTP
jgi:hypothetical protein